MKFFISHQKRDRDQAEKIAKYFKTVGIDVYFDEFDSELQIALKENNPKAVVTAIKKGIKNSTHMLCLISPNTLYSKWVPFEVGYGYDITELSILTLKGISNKDLPDYVRIATIVRDIYDIEKLIKRSGKMTLLEKTGSVDYKYNSLNHPLSGVMDSIITK